MDWLCLGHATWLVRAGGLRLLFDPLLGERHHGDVFEVVPRRAVVAEALRPDVVLVSHRHPDHFDVPSLRRLIALDPEVVLVTPDPLVAWAAGELGARDVRVVAPGTRVDLDGVSLITTPSLAPDEWGAMLATPDGVAWNQVDTVLANATAIRELVAACLKNFDRAALELALVRWQPMLEVAAQLGRATAFPYGEYAALLEQIAATGAGTIVPSASGEAYTAAWSAMNRQVFPVGEARFLRDLAAVSPATRGLPCTIGGLYRVRGGAVAYEPGGAGELVTIVDPADPRRYRPFELPPVGDPGLASVEVSTMRADLEGWIRGPLARGLADACAGLPVGALSMVVELRFASEVEAFTLRVGGGEAAVERGFEDDWDGLCVIAGSVLWEVVQGRKHWGDALLAGALRACSRAYGILGGALRPIALGEIFLYHGLSYDDSVRRAVQREVSRLRPR